jgi:RNA polymerase sigma-70 factor (ECF subfamily)
MQKHESGERDDLQGLVETAREGSRSAFDELVRRTYVDTYTLALRLTGHEEDARDVVQEAYLRAWKGIRRFRGDAQFSTWMYRITANTAYTHVKRRNRLRTTNIDDIADPIEMHLDATPEASAEAAAGLSELAAAVDQLPESMRQIVILKDVYGLTHEAIAEELDISIAAAKVRLHRGRKRLRDVLDDMDGRTAHAV